MEECGGRCTGSVDGERGTCGHGGLQVSTGERRTQGGLAQLEGRVVDVGRQKRDAAVAEGQQVRDGLAHPLGEVELHRGQLRVVVIGEDQTLAQGGNAGDGRRAPDNKAFHGEGGECGEDPLLSVALLLCVHQDDGVAPRAGNTLGALVDRREEGIVDLGHKQGDHPGLAEAQRAGGGIRLIAHRLGGRKDRRAELGGHAALCFAVKHEGNRGLRHPELLGDRAMGDGGAAASGGAVRHKALVDGQRTSGPSLSWNGLACGGYCS
jgi:hypothetical protein